MELLDCQVHCLLALKKKAKDLILHHTDSFFHETETSWDCYEIDTMFRCNSFFFLFFFHNKHGYLFIIIIILLLEFVGKSFFGWLDSQFSKFYPMLEPMRIFIFILSFSRASQKFWNICVNGYHIRNNIHGQSCSLI